MLKNLNGMYYHMKSIYRISGTIVLIFLSHSCDNQQIVKDQHTFPRINTRAISEISRTTATSGGYVLDDGEDPLVSTGVCWNTSSDPTIEDNKTTDIGQSGPFTSTLNQLTPNTLYYVRAYATNHVGTGYGKTLAFTTLRTILINPELTYGTVTDIDNNVYKTTTIGTQTWMAENLKTTRYRNGDLIGTTNPASLDISNESIPKYQWTYNGKESNADPYGRLYTWYTVNDSRNVCPTGWHVPDNAEWTTLTDYLADKGYGYGGSGNQIAKSMATYCGWITDGTSGNPGNDQGSNNSSGLSALPAGARGRDSFGNMGITCFWWSANEESTGFAGRLYLTFGSGKVYIDYSNKQDGYSVRCLRDI